MAADSKCHSAAWQAVGAWVASANRSPASTPPACLSLHWLRSSQAPREEECSQQPGLPLLRLRPPLLPLWTEAHKQEGVKIAGIQSCKGCAYLLPQPQPWRPQRLPLWVAAGLAWMMLPLPGPWTCAPVCGRQGLGVMGCAASRPQQAGGWGHTKKAAWAARRPSSSSGTRRSWCSSSCSSRAPTCRAAPAPVRDGPCKPLL
jgi:hypothetical protein